MLSETTKKLKPKIRPVVKLKSVQVLKLKLLLEQEQSDELLRIGEICRRGKNAGGVNWFMRQHGFPETKQQSERLCKHAKYADKPKSESTKIYHAVRAAAPELTGTMHSMLAGQVASYLSAKLDWRRNTSDSVEADGKPVKLKRSDAILKYDDRLPNFTAIEIPVRAAEASLRYGDQTFLSCRLVSSGTTVLKVATGDLPGRIKLLLKELAKGSRKLEDSRLIFREEKKTWYWYVTIQRETRQISGGREAVLSPTMGSEKVSGQSDRPFKLKLPERSWGVGDGRYLLSQTRRIVAMKKEIGWRYQQRNGAGHGRKKVDAKISQVSRVLRNIVDEVRRRTIVDIVKQCLQDGCGKLVYREPTLPVRTKTWFCFKLLESGHDEEQLLRQGLDWNWTRFLGDLQNACNRAGISLEKRPLKMEEVKRDEQTTAGV